MGDYTLLMIAAIPLSIFVFYRIINSASQNQDTAAPQFKIETVASGNGPMYFVYRNLGFPGGWSITPSHCSSSLQECERWIERAKTVKEETVYR